MPPGLSAGHRRRGVRSDEDVWPRGAVPRVARQRPTMQTLTLAFEATCAVRGYD
jgi:hypothetical protein